MSFAENLQYLRKQKNITQEQLSEQLEVSRQSVSKWESGGSFPEMEKLLQLCTMFNCDMDTLMQGDISKKYATDAFNYDETQNKFGRLLTAGVALVLTGISTMCFLVGFGLSEAIATIIMMVFIIVAAMLFVVMGLQSEQYKKKHPIIEDFYTEQQKEKSESAFTVRMTVGIGMILIDVLWIIAGSTLLESTKYVWPGFTAERMDSLLIGSFMLIIAAAVSVIVYSATQKEKYELEGFKEIKVSKEEKKRNSLMGKINGCIWLVAVCIYLVLGFVAHSWGSSWVVFLVAGILSAITGIVFKKDEE